MIFISEYILQGLSVAILYALLNSIYYVHNNVLNLF